MRIFVLTFILGCPLSYLVVSPPSLPWIYPSTPCPKLFLLSFSQLLLSLITLSWIQVAPIISFAIALSSGLTMLLRLFPLKRLTVVFFLHLLVVPFAFVLSLVSVRWLNIYVVAVLLFRSWLPMLILRMAR